MIAWNGIDAAAVYKKVKKIKLRKSVHFQQSLNFPCAGDVFGDMPDPVTRG